MKKHSTKTTRPCAHCGHRFTINPCVGIRHRYCAKPDCVHVSRAKARKRWLRKNGGKRYFSGKDNTDRVRIWRDKHPRYWRRESRIQRSRRHGFVFTKKMASALRYVALQDLLDTHLALNIGLISAHSGLWLQDQIAKELRRLTLRGHAILRGKKPKL